MRVFFILLITSAVPISAGAQTNQQPAGVQLEPLVVQGSVPGPDLWRVTDGRHELWILGTLSPLPKRMKWNTQPIEDIIKLSQAVMTPPAYTTNLDGIGFFKKLSLARAAIGIKKNPDKEQLIDVLPQNVYARWLVLKKKYLSNSKRIEKQRPIFASNKLFEKALSKTGLTEKTEISKKLLKLAKKHKIEIIRPQIQLTLKDPKQTIKDFK